MYVLKWLDEYEETNYDYAEDIETAIEWLFLKNIEFIDEGFEEGINVIYEDIFGEEAEELGMTGREAEIKEFVREDLRNGYVGRLYDEYACIYLQKTEPTVTSEKLKILRERLEK